MLLSEDDKLAVFMLSVYSNAPRYAILLFYLLQSTINTKRINLNDKKIN